MNGYGSGPLRRDQTPAKPPHTMPPHKALGREHSRQGSYSDHSRQNSYSGQPYSPYNPPDTHSHPAGTHSHPPLTHQPTSPSVTSPLSIQTSIPYRTYSSGSQNSYGKNNTRTSGPSSGQTISYSQQSGLNSYPPGPQQTSGGYPGSSSQLYNSGGQGYSNGDPYNNSASYNAGSYNTNNSAQDITDADDNTKRFYGELLFYTSKEIDKSNPCFMEPNKP